MTTLTISQCARTYEPETEPLLVIFTKDRPDRLRLTLPSLSALGLKTVLLDDSSHSAMREATQRLADEYLISYHGPREQVEVVRSFPNLDITAFTGALGSGEWNLGNNRNYAILLTRLLSFRKVVFSDDDVRVPQPGVLSTMVRGTPFSRALGPVIEGMPDHSIVGHLYRRAGLVIQPQAASGTFCCLSLEGLGYYYPNTYNEDWLWVTLECGKHRVDRKLQIEQLQFDPFASWSHKLFFQEYGEVLWEGVYLATQHEMLPELETVDLWHIALQQRRERINGLSRLRLDWPLADLCNNIHTAVHGYLERLQPWAIAVFWRKYLNRLNHWRTLVDQAAGLVT